MGFTTLMDDFCGSPFWDEKLLWNSTNPDLTPCFENTVLVWVPCIFLWLCAPLECYFQKKSIQKALPWTGANISRMIIALALSILCTINILDSLFNKYEENYYLAVIASSSLKTLTFLFALTLMLFNRKRGRHTSGILFMFWFFLMLCEIFPYRSAFLGLQNETSVPDEISFVTHMMYFPLLVAETILCFVADIRYRHPLSKKDARKECPERAASFPSKILFWWFNSMSLLGWKRPLTMDDLYDLNPEDRTEYVSTQFEKHYRHSTWSYPTSPSSLKEESKRNEETEASNIDNGVEFIVRNGREEQPKKRIHIIQTLAKTFSGYFMAGSILKLIYDLLQFLNPLILKLLITYVESDDPIWIGILYASFTFLNGTLQSVILGTYFQRMFVLGMRVRTALVTAIYKKSLVLSSSAKKESTVGEIVNLMSVDSQRFMDLMTYLNLVWSAPLQIIIALLMLFRVLGIAVLSGLLVSIILIPLNALMATQVKKKQVKQMKCKDERVKLVNEILSGIKVLKLYAWEEAFKEKIYKIREKEVKHLKGIAYLNSLSMMIWSCSPFFVSLVSFATFVLIDENNHLDASTAFVSLSLFNILRFPLTMLPHLITTIVMVSVSVKRIDKFMNSEELERYVTYDTTQSSSVCVRNGEFTWDRPEEGKERRNARPTLSNINLLVPKNSLIAVVGQVGSGKSSLFSAILGEMDRLQGSVTLNGKVAYVSQQPWIQNSTLQNNILFSKSLSRREYDEVLDSCSLKPDLEILPGGDQTEIGEKGINLSGGQKQRVSLARAVYSSADIYLLDDPLSAVDSHVGKHIFEKVIGPKGLLRSKTRVLVTHSLTYLPQTDMIYVMKDGAIAEKGSFQELVDSKGPFADFLAQYGSQIEAEDLSDLPPELLRSLSQKSNTPEDENIPEADIEDSKNMTAMSINRLQEKRSSTLSASIEKSASLKDNVVKLINIEAAETGQVKFSVYSEYLKAIRYKWVAIIFCAYTIWQIFSVGSNVWLSEWGNDPKLNDTSDHSLRDYRLGVYGALGLAQAIGVFVGSFSVAYGTLAAANILHTGILTNVLRSPMSFFDTTPLGRIVNRFAKDVDTVDVTIPMTLRSWLSCLLQVISTILVISIQTPLFMVVIIPISVIYYIIQRFYLSTSRQLKRLESITRSPIYSHFSETLSGASTIRAYKAEERFCSQSNSFVDNNQVCYYPSIIANRWLAIRLDFCGNIIILFSALFAVLQKDSLDAGKVGLSVTYGLMVTATLNWMVRMSSELETNIVAVERILEYSSTPTEAEWIVKDKRPPPEWPQNGAVVMNNYSTRYRKNLDLVLKQVCCDIKAGEKVGIVGRTGAGKSSLTLSLFRIIEASEGSISVDGQIISEIGLHDLRSKITIIPQDPVLFSGTLRMNLDPFGSYSDSQLWDSLEHAHLKSFVSSLDDGLEHEVIEGGENLSVGQRQLVCLARALLRKTKILVLDEATAAVDLETDSLIQVTIREEFRNSSVLTIAHRLNTVMDYDRIMVLDQGEVAEFDAPNILLKDKKSIFYGMAKDAGLV